MRFAYLIINGKKAGLPEIREAVGTLRAEGHDIQVRVTWEYGDGLRYVQEAHNKNADIVIAGGGDGTVNEICHGLALIESEAPGMAVLPLGTANDFATACTIPMDPYEAMKLSVTKAPTPIDIIKINDRYVINVASAGFGAAVTAETPAELKTFLAGGAYTLMGIIKLLNFTSYPAKIKTDEFEFNGDAIIGAICNGRQAGGGQVLAPNAYINDGKFDILLAKSFPLWAIDQVIAEVREPTPDGEYVVSVQGTWLEAESDIPSPVNLDGEPIRVRKQRYDLLPGLIKLVVPDTCPCIMM